MWYWQNTACTLKFTLRYNGICKKTLTNHEYLLHIYNDQYSCIVYFWGFSCSWSFSKVKLWLNNKWFGFYGKRYTNVTFSYRRHRTAVLMSVSFPTHKHRSKKKHIQLKNRNFWRHRTKKWSAVANRQTIWSTSERRYLRSEDFSEVLLGARLADVGDKQCTVSRLDVTSAAGDDGRFWPGRHGLQRTWRTGYQRTSGHWRLGQRR